MNLKTQKTTTRIATILTATFILCASAANLSATIIAQDTFENANLGALNGQSSGTGWSAAWTSNSSTKIVAKTLTYSSGTISLSGGNKAIYGDNTNTSSTNLDATRQFAAIPAGTTVYMSFLFQQAAGSSFTGDVLDFMLGDSKTSYRNAAGINASSSNSGTGVFGATAYGATDNSKPVPKQGIAVGNEITHLLVAKITINTGGGYSVYFTVNPNSVTEPTTYISATDQVSMVGSWFGAATVPEGKPITTFLIRNANLDVGDGYYLDNLTIATTYAEVVATTAIPEPASFAYIGGALVLALGLCYRRRLQGNR